MIVNGIELDGLCEETQDVQFPPVVPGRTVHIDADFLAYQVSYEKEDDPKTFEDMQHNADVSIEMLRGLAAAEHSILYLTPKDSNKGERYRTAILKEYQGNRDGKDKPRHLTAVRSWMGAARGAVMCRDCEADDGMAMAQYAAIAEGNENLSIIASKDKDLRMVPGLHLDWSLGRIGGTPSSDPFGSIWVHERKKVHASTGKETVVKKVQGFGWKFFWLQMLMGDAADNVSGLPLVAGPIMNKVKPTAASKKKPEARKPGQCGQMLAYELLKGVKTNQQAFQVVKALYNAHPEPFVHWKTGQPAPAASVFLSEAQSLWMRRNSTCKTDFLDWAGEHCI